MISDHRRCWAPAGVRPEVPRQVVRKYTYAFCAVSPEDGVMDSLVLPFENSETMSMFVAEVASRHLDEYVAMFMDQAGWHISKDVKVPENMCLRYIPPHSPELNPAEHIWDEVSEKWIANRFYKNFESVEDRLCEALASLEQNPAKVKSMTAFPWILNGIMDAK